MEPLLRSVDKALLECEDLLYVLIILDEGRYIIWVWTRINCVSKPQRRVIKED